MLISAQTGGMSANYAAYAREGYSQNPDVYACVREISMACAGIPILLMQHKGDGQIEPVQKHPLVDLLRRPNPQLSGPRFIERLISYLLLAGTAYPYRAAPNTRQPQYQELYLLRPDYVEVKEGDAKNPIAGYVYNIDKGQQMFTPEEVLQVPFFNPLNELYGLSPMQAAARSADIGNRGREWNFWLLNNSARPPGGFTMDGELGPEQFERLRQQIMERYSGSANAGRPLLLEGGMKWAATGLTPAEMEWQGSQIFSTRDICKVFNVAPELIGDSANKTYSNYAEARKALYQETVLPLLDFVLAELTWWLARSYGEDLAFGYRRDNIEALQEDQTALYTRLQNAHWLTVNEKRLQVGFGELDGEEHDRILVPNTLVPIAAAGLTLMGGAGPHGVKGVLPAMTPSQHRFAEAVRPLLEAQRSEVIRNLEKGG